MDPMQVIAILGVTLLGSGLLVARLPGCGHTCEACKAERAAERAREEEEEHQRYHALYGITTPCARCQRR